MVKSLGFKPVAHLRVISAEKCNAQQANGPFIKGMGFGINPAIYTNADGLYNALGGLQYLASKAAVKAATILTPHIYGDSTTGMS